MLRSQRWHSDVIDDATFASLLSLIHCLPGSSTLQLVTALGVLQSGNPYGGLVAFGCFSGTGGVLMALLGSLKDSLSQA